MQAFEFNDSDGQHITIQHDSGYGYRIYVKKAEYGETKPVKEEAPVCIHLSKSQAQIVISALEDLLEDE